MIKLTENEALMVLVDLVQESDELPAKARLEVDGKVKWLLKQHEQISDPQWALYHRKWKATSRHDEFYESAITVLEQYSRNTPSCLRLDVGCRHRCWSCFGYN